MTIYPRYTNVVLRSMGYQVDTDFVISSSADGIVFDQWTSADPQPTVDDINAAWPAAQRSELEKNIRGQIPASQKLNPDAAGIDRDTAQRGQLRLMALRDTADAALDTFDPKLTNQALDGAYVSQVQAEQIQALLTIDDQFVNISSTLAYDPTERSDIEASLSAALVSVGENKRPSTPPAAAREGVRVPDETVDKLLVERAEFASPWPGHWLTATLWTDDATEGANARLTPYSETGTPLGVYPFTNNGDGSWTLSTQSSEGQRTAEPRILQYEFLYGTGSASVIRRQTLTVEQPAREHKARYGAPVDVAVVSTR